MWECVSVMEQYQEMFVTYYGFDGKINRKARRPWIT